MLQGKPAKGPCRTAEWLSRALLQKGHIKLKRPYKPGKTGDHTGLYWVEVVGAEEALEGLSKVRASWVKMDVFGSASKMRRVSGLVKR